MTTAPAPTIARPGVPPRDRPRRHARELAWLIDRRAQILASIAVAAIVVGGLLHAVGSASAGDAVWAGAVALLAAELAFEVGRSIVVEHSLGVDTIALVAMVGALALGELLAGVGDRLDVLRWRRARIGRLPACATGADGVDPARTEGRAAPRR